MTCKNKDKCNKSCKSDFCKDDLKISQQEIKDLIASVLNIPKTLDTSSAASLPDQMAEMEQEVMRQLDTVKDTVAKICKQAMTEHKCQGVVPGTLLFCGEDDYQYCSESCLNIARAAKSLQVKWAEKLEKDELE